MTEKRFRMEIIEGATLPFIVDNSTAKKQNDKITSYKTYETHQKDKCLELVNLLNELNDDKILLTEFAQHNYNETEKIIKNLQKQNKDAWNLIRFIYNEIKENGSMDFGRIKDLVEFV